MACINSRQTAKPDVELMLVDVLRRNLWLTVGSVGAAGRSPHLAEVQEVIDEIAREQALHSRVPGVHAR